MIFLKRFKKKIASTFMDHVDRTDIIIMNQLCYGYNTDVSHIKNIPYELVDLKYVKYGICMLWIRFRYFGPQQVFIRYFNIMMPIIEICSKGYPYLTRYFVVCIENDHMSDRTKLEYLYKTKEITYDLFGRLHKIEKTNVIKYILPCKIVVNYIKN